MDDGSPEFLKTYLDGLNLSGFPQIDPLTFKHASGFSKANWEGIDVSGLGVTKNIGRPIPANAFAWGNTMPIWGTPTYQKGYGFYNKYKAFVNALRLTGQNANTILNAKTVVNLFKMKSASGLRSWASYTFSPSLSGFFQASLVGAATNTKPKIDFSIESTSGDTNSYNLIRDSSSLDKYDTRFANSSTVNNTSPSDANSSDTSLLNVLAYRFTAQNAEMFDVRPAGWYIPAMVTDYYDQINPKSALANKPFFGDGGYLNLRVLKIFVVFKKCVTLYGSNGSGLASQYADPASGNQFNIGSVQFKGGLRNSVRTIRGGVVSFRDVTNTPHVLGVVVDILGPSQSVPITS